MRLPAKDVDLQVAGIGQVPEDQDGGLEDDSRQFTSLLRWLGSKRNRGSLSGGGLFSRNVVFRRSGWDLQISLLHLRQPLEL